MNIKKERRESVQLNCEGQKIFGVIHYPAEVQGKCPAVIFCHGLGGHKVGTHRVSVDIAEALASMGIVAMRFDFRGAGDSEGAFSDMSIASQMADAREVLDFLKHDPLVDAGRIGIYGRSFGGLIAILAAAGQERIKSVALWAPVFSAQPWIDKWKAAQALPKESSEKQSLMQVNGMTPGMALFQQLFALNLEKELAKLGDVPLMHICGEKDQLVTLFHAENYERVRKGASKSTFIRLPESDHEFSNSSERDKAVKDTIEWFKNTL
jgi:dienelactone hydrolase